MPTLQVNLPEACRCLVRFRLKAFPNGGSLPPLPRTPQASFGKWAKSVSSRLPREYLDQVQVLWGLCEWILAPISGELCNTVLQHIRCEPYQWLNPAHANQDHAVHQILDAASTYWFWTEWTYLRDIVRQGWECRLFRRHWRRYLGPQLSGSTPDLDHVLPLAYVLTGLLHDTGYLVYILRQLAADVPFRGLGTWPDPDWTEEALRNSLLADLLATCYEVDLLARVRDGSLGNKDFFWAAAQIRHVQNRLKQLDPRGQNADLVAALEFAAAFTFFHDFCWDGAKLKDKQIIVGDDIRSLGLAGLMEQSRFDVIPGSALFMLADAIQLGARPALLGSTGQEMQLHVVDGVSLELDDPDSGALRIHGLKQGMQNKTSLGKASAAARATWADNLTKLEKGIAILNHQEQNKAISIELA